jgi:hypothetical protein
VAPSWAAHCRHVPRDGAAPGGSRHAGDLNTLQYIQSTHYKDVHKSAFVFFLFLHTTVLARARFRHLTSFHGVHNEHARVLYSVMGSCRSHQAPPSAET